MGDFVRGKYLVKSLGGNSIAKKWLENLFEKTA